MKLLFIVLVAIAVVTADVSELPSKYLPPGVSSPVEVAAIPAPAPPPVSIPAPVPVAAPAPVPEPVPIPISAPAPVNIGEPESGQLSDDGYRYKTVRRIRYRYRH